MITVDARLRDGRSALDDLQYASPGGLVGSEWRPGALLRPGDLIRKDGWSVVLRAGTITFLNAAGRVLDTVPAVDYLAASGPAGRAVFWLDTGAEVRTDARIDPATLAGIPAGASGCSSPDCDCAERRAGGRS